MSEKKLATILFAVLMMIITSAVSAAELKLKSPVEAVPVLELFTSHGCSSCPPADRWLRGLSKDKRLWKEFIPMAFHVDYWDYLGWKDKFAKSRYSDRQRVYRSVGNVRSVYTPGFVVGGREWRGWFRGGKPPLSLGEKRGQLNANVMPGEMVNASFEPIPGLHNLKLKAHVAILGFGISSDIGAGENSGRILKEDFVVLGDSSSTPNNDMEWSIPWPFTANVKTSRKAVVVWLSLVGNPTPVQAVAGWLN